MRNTYTENRCYFRQAYETGRHGWQSDEASPYVERNLAKVAPGGRLLDLGCGEGRHCFVAARMGFRPTGVDYEPLAIRRACDRAEQAGLLDRVYFVVADIFALPFRRASFDVLLDYGCLHHQRKSDWGRYRAAVLSVLKPGGHLLLSTFSTNFRTYGPQERSWHLAHGAYRRFFTADDLHQLFDRDFEFLSLQEERDEVRGFWHALLARKP
jgi:SAM-dependent methyltransferase